MEKQGFDLAMHYFRAFAIFSVISVHMWIVPPLEGHESMRRFLDMLRGVLFHSSTLYFVFISGYLFHFLAQRKFDLRTYYRKKLLNVIGSGIPNAIRVAKEVLEPMGKRLKGIRIDSGDLAYLSKKIRKMLDDAGLEDCKIVVSNSLDEYTITSILQQGGKIDSFGVGERLITAKSDPVFGAVYKISAVEENGTFAPRIKISENVEKITNPGLKDVYRIYDEAGHSVADLITKAGEKVDMSVPYRYADPVKPWKNRSFENCTAKKLQQQVVKAGKRIVELETLEEIRTYVEKQLNTEVWEEEQRFENPHEHYLDMSPAYYEMKMDMLHESRTR